MMDIQVSAASVSIFSRYVAYEELNISSIFWVFIDVEIWALRF